MAAGCILSRISESKMEIPVQRILRFQGGEMRSSQKRLVSILVCALFALFTLAVNVSAQDLTGKIRGAVTDPLGASVPGAEVKAPSGQTQVSATVPTERDETFQFLSLPAGTYAVAVSKAGFRTVT